MSPLHFLCALALAPAAAGCSVDLRETCAGNDDCPADHRCADTYCVVADGGAPPRRDATADGDAHAMVGPAPDAAPPPDARAPDPDAGPPPDARVADAAAPDAAAPDAAPRDAAPPPDAGAPDLGPPPCVPADESPRGLVINEIDYDMPGGGEDGEFIELRNGSCGHVDLGGWRLRLLNGDLAGDQRTYLELDLRAASPLLASGAYLVVADPHVQTGPDVPRLLLGGTAFASQIQNGPGDGVVLLDPEDRVVDAVVYEGRIPGIGEGGPAPGDPDDHLRFGIGRCPDGADGDDNAADFRAQPVTPGRPNECPPD
jgi:hypothetical protein